MAEAPRFRSTREGVEILDEWPKEMTASREFLEGADPRFVRRRWRTVTFSPTNGIASYRIVARNADSWMTPKTYLLVRKF